MTNLKRMRQFYLSYRERIGQTPSGLLALPENHRHYATSVDYNKDAPTTKAFFAKVQNKLHFAVHGNTAAELIMQRADSTKTNMGLTTLEKAPEGKILKTDVSVVKNYMCPSRNRQIWSRSRRAKNLTGGIWLISKD